MSLNQVSESNKQRKWLSLIDFILCMAIIVVSVVLISALEYVFAVLFICISLSGMWVYRSRAGRPYRLMYPALAAIFSFSVLPLLFTLFMSVTNYTSSNMNSVEAVTKRLLQEYYVTEVKYDYQVLADGELYRLKLMRDDESYLSNQFSLPPVASQALSLRAGGASLFLPEADLTKQVMFRRYFASEPLVLPSGQQLTRLDFSAYGLVAPRYRQLNEGLVLANGTMLHDVNTLFDNQTEHFLRANMTTGFFHAIDGQGEFIGPPVTPGFVLLKGADQYAAIISDPAMLLPLLKVLLWTFMFALLSLLGSFLIGLILAQLTLNPLTRFSYFYRGVLLLPWAIPPFVSILSFKVLLTPHGGELANLLTLLFSTTPDWANDADSARYTLVGLSIWLGYPYVMLLVLASLRRIPSIYYETAAMAGYGPIQRFIHVTFPLVIKPLKPVLVALFAFNLHNFVLVFLFNQGRPVMLDAFPVAGYSQLLLNYVYSIAFSAEQNYALASAITSFGLVLIGIVALGCWRWLNNEVNTTRGRRV
ncbi:ABC transporter permease subunit [Motilimonas sp. 1_MG-2023]|uniref:ABC transporter permease subunit n=1 Tax=Motilimonas sp. 1_MG-2023 TaxID=3062672 RepID=UPI0026E2F427|nr:ABC transporter permease subunit [Motilimonas sp. 1_MG-2023]MDO6524756.1 ABC transporter permease subunit [Motilimonas sp. 1_MG-2023]